jgi:hypothetical protein
MRSKLLDSVTLTGFILLDTRRLLLLSVKNNKHDPHAKFIRYDLSIELGP